MKKLYFFLLSFTSSFLFSNAWAQEDDFSSPPIRDEGFMQTIIMIAVALAFFYLILWRPEQKRRKALEKQRAELQKGARVTAMGIIGTVSKVQKDTVVLKMVDGSKIEFLKAAITDVAENNEAKKDDSKEESAEKKEK